jgi:hypothetical protein
MANGAAAAAGLMVVSRLLAPSVADAAELHRVVLHLTDYQEVAPGELTQAQQLVVRAYGRIGVQLVWAGRPDGVRPDDGNLHVRVSILDQSMSERHNPDVNALGQGSHGAKWAHIYYPRIVTYARRTQSDPARVLAVVIAHELGHVLLPEYSHTRTGLMQPTTDERIVDVPSFLPAQASVIRQMVAAGR